MHANTQHPERASAPEQLRVERLDDAIGVGTATPRLSWKIRSAPSGWAAIEAEAECMTTDGHSETTRIGAGGVVESWPFAPLRSRERRSIRVRVLGSNREWTSWSESLAVEAGVLDPAEWTADFIAAPWVENTRTDQAPPLVRGTVRLRELVASARLRSTSLGLHEIEIDGVRVGEDLLSPGWTSYAHRLRYVTHDVTEQLRAASAPGGADEVVIGGWLADGWYRGRLGWNDRVRNVWGDTLALMVQLEIEYADGSHEVIGTDSTWRAARGPILRSGIYDGERYDGGGLPQGWSSPGFDDSSWEPVRVLSRPTAELVAYDGPPVRVTETVEPVAIAIKDGGARQFDFGQNLVGRLRVRSTEPEQGGLRLRHAEVVQDGELALRPLRTAEAMDTFWPSPAPDAQADGASTGTWAPRFTFHGFRFADIEGLRDDPAPGEVTAEVIHSDMRRTGWFRASDPRLERLHENVVWSMRGNFVDVPTDCPQRDERLGWTGDLQVFAPTAAFLYECSGVLRSWLRDLAADQRPSGSVPHFVPDVPALDPENGFTTIWGDAATLTPWDLYTAFADEGMLAEQYPAARRWVEGLRGIAADEVLILDQFQYGDWLDPTAPPEDALAAKADRYLLATAHYQRSAAVLARMADVLGKGDDALRFADLSERIRVAFLERFSPEPGVLVDDAQASYAVAIRFGLFGDAETARLAGDRLAALVRANGHRIGTGFAGTPVICDALVETGHLDDAYAMLLQEECPSWLFPVSRGATTIWERWDSLLPNGRVNNGGMTSFNHYALGAVADFLHRVVAGLAPAAPGYRRILFRPRPGGGLTSAGATLETPHGEAAIDWSIAGGEFRVRMRVPVGTTATLDLADIGGGTRELTHGNHEVRVGI